MPLGPIEYHILQFYQTQTLPVLCSVFPSEFWERSVLAVAYSVPAIMRLILAISAYHQNLNTLGANAWQKSNCFEPPDATVLYALRNHTEAARLVRESASSKKPPMRIIKMACIIFTVLEFLRGNRNATISHILNGMKLLGLSNLSRQQDLFEREVDWTLSRLSLLQSLYGRPKRALFPALRTVPISVLGNCDTPLASIQDARNSIFILSALIFQFFRRTQHGQPSPPNIDDLIEQHKLDSLLSQWLNKVEELTTRAPSKAEAGVIRLLRVYHTISLIFLKTSTIQSQVSFDQYIPEFCSAIDALELVVDSIQQSAIPVLFSLDLGIIPCLFYTTIKCRHPRLRRRALSLLGKAPRREGLWDSREASVVAEHVIQFEERVMPKGKFDGAYSISEEARIQDVDIVEIKLDGRILLSVAFRWKPDATCTGFDESSLYIQVV